MSEFTCPNCRGGFPEGPANDGCCPWCGQTINGEYEPPDGPHAIREVREDESEDEFQGLLSLFK